MLTTKQQLLVDLYQKIANDNGGIPTRADFLENGISRDIIRHHFTSLTALKDYVTENVEGFVLPTTVIVAQPKPDEDSLAARRNELIEIYNEIIAVEKAYPTYNDLYDAGITKDMINRHFGNIAKMREHVEENFPDHIKTHIFSVENLFDPSRSATAIKKTRLIVTTAVAGSPAHEEFVASMRQYAEYNNAQIVIMPCESVTNSFENKSASFDPLFHDSDFLFVQQDTKVNDNLSLCSIQVSAKQIKPITGLSRLGRRDGSYIFAAPKQFLDYQPSGNSRHDNYSIMTTGACTKPNYYTERFVSKRLSYLASHDHTLGAVIVEVVNDKTFHFRQIQAQDDGSFVDLGVRYDGVSKPALVPCSVVLGDLHAAQVDSTALNSALRLTSQLHVENLFLHDVFDGLSVNHHVTAIGAQALRHSNGKSNLAEELAMTFEVIKQIDDAIVPDNLWIVKSNHDEVIDRYISEGRYLYDAENHYTALKIATAPFEGVDPLYRGFEVAGKNIPHKWNFLKRNASVRVYGVECAAHGDLGINGAKGSLSSFEMTYGDCIIGHAHSAAIHRGVFRVGTMTEMDMGYNRGPSSWTHTFALLYRDGSRQLINVISGSTNEPVYGLGNQE